MRRWEPPAKLRKTSTPPLVSLDEIEIEEEPDPVLVDDVLDIVLKMGASKSKTFYSLLSTNHELAAKVNEVNFMRDVALRWLTSEQYDRLVVRGQEAGYLPSELARQLTKTFTFNVERAHAKSHGFVLVTFLGGNDWATEDDHEVEQEASREDRVLISAKDFWFHWTLLQLPLLKDDADEEELYANVNQHSFLPRRWEFIGVTVPQFDKQEAAQLLPTLANHFQIDDDNENDALHWHSNKWKLQVAKELFAVIVANAPKIADCPPFDVSKPIYGLFGVLIPAPVTQSARFAQFVQRYRIKRSDFIHEITIFELDKFLEWTPKGKPSLVAQQIWEKYREEMGFDGSDDTLLQVKIYTMPENAQDPLDRTPNSDDDDEGDNDGFFFVN